MSARRLLLTAAAVLLAAPQTLDAQLLDRLKKTVRDVKETVEDVESVRCAAQGVCGDVQMSEYFDPAAYESLAVTVFDGSGEFGGEATDGIVRDAFEKRLLQNGYLLASSSDASQVRERIGRSEEAWTDADLAQLKEFIHGIDAVLVVDIRRVDMGRCELDGRANAGTEVTVQMSARWLHVDAGDVPWVATHQSSVCRSPSEGTAIRGTALETTAQELATALPAQEGEGNLQ